MVSKVVIYLAQHTVSDTPWLSKALDPLHLRQMLLGISSLTVMVPFVAVPFHMKAIAGASSDSLWPTAEPQPMMYRICTMQCG